MASVSPALQDPQTSWDTVSPWICRLESRLSLYCFPEGSRKRFSLSWAEGAMARVAWGGGRDQSNAEDERGPPLRDPIPCLASSFPCSETAATGSGRSPLVCDEHTGVHHTYVSCSRSRFGFAADRGMYLGGDGGGGQELIGLNLVPGLDPTSAEGSVSVDGWVRAR